VTRTVRRSIAASAATLSLLAFAGCGGNDDTSNASDDTSASSSTSESADAGAMSTATTDTEDDTSGDSGAAAGEEISAEEFTGILQKALDDATTANIEMTSSMGLSATGQIDYSADPPTAKMKTTMAQTGDMEMILLGNVFYMKGAMFGGGDKWVKLDLSDPSNPMSALGDQLDPAASLQKLQKGIQKAVFVGEEDGQKHYTATVDTKALLEGTPAEAQSAAGLPDTVDYQLWFDGDGLISKFSFDMGATAGTTEATFTDWGTDVDITAPPESEVTTMPGM
jgi:hypothetical protein